MHIYLVMFNPMLNKANVEGAVASSGRCYGAHVGRRSDSPQVAAKACSKRSHRKGDFLYDMSWEQY